MLNTSFSLRPLLALGLLALAGVSAQAGETARTPFVSDVRPVLAEFCFRCHGERKQLADVRLDTLDPDLLNGSDGETWHDVLGKLNNGEMPPEDEPQPSQSQRAAVVDWLTAELRKAAAAKRSTGGRVVMRRLTRYEYRNTMRDLLGVDLDFARDLPPESTSPDGFLNDGRTLALSPLQIELYLEAAQRGLSKAIVTGPEPEVVRESVEKPDKVRRVKGQVSNRLQGPTKFVLRLEEFPREGRFRVRVRARAEVPEGAAWPRLRVSVGHRADVLAPQKTLGEVDVRPDRETTTFEFTGRIETFPLPGHNPKYPGLVVTATNATHAKPDGRKRKRRGKKNAEDPTKAVIVVESLEFEGPLFETWPPAAHRRILFDSEQRDDETAYARQVVERFAARAFRRPVTEAEVAEFVAFFEEVRPVSPSFEDAMRHVLAMVLVSPDFLYLVEPVAENGAARPLNDHELAARLSYFLWSTMPDDELRALADAGRLRDPGVWEKTVRSMLADPRSAEFVDHFTEQWLDLSSVDRVAVNPEFFPGFDERLKADAKEETRRFFGELLRENASVLRLVDADFTMLNRRLAEHYGLSGPRGSEFERVQLAEGDHRGGLLTQASVLLGNSNGEQSHPIKRAVWLRTRLLDDPPAPPPPDVPELDENDPDLAKLSLKEQLEVHRNKAACNACHREIDPWGVAFENFDAVGRWRTHYAPHPKSRRKKKSDAEGEEVDATSTLPGGHEVAGVAGLQQHLLTRDRDRVARAVVRKLLAYAIGRSLESSDDESVDELTRALAKNDCRLADLVLAITRSRPFRTK